MTRIGATLFSGGRGVEALLTDAIDFRLSVEYDPAIATVGAQLGGETIVRKVEDVDYSTWPELYYLHASPVCKEYSQAKSGGAEGEADLSSATAVVRCLETTRPRVFTLENVGAYQHGQAYRRVCAWLNHNGYMWHAEVLNAADFGVPQTRRRLILRAVRDALLPPLPAPEPWIGWYAAIEDLIPTLPESAFAPWQEIRLKVKIYGEIYEMKRRTARAWLVQGQNARTEEKGGLCVLNQDEPAFTVTNANKGVSRAWLSAGRVVKMTPRALARFQSFPDWYVLPSKAALACTVIGNAVPPLLMSKIVRQLL